MQDGTISDVKETRTMLKELQEQTLELIELQKGNRQCEFHTVKPFKQKNYDKIALVASNTNLKDLESLKVIDNLIT